VTWYDSLAKPSWTPQPSVIGTIWTILYPVIFVVFGCVIVRVIRGDIPWPVVIPIAVNLAANFAFTPIQFGLRNLPLATVDILVVLVTIVWAMVVIWPYARWASLALIPYLMWGATASVLQISITVMNR
jgi:tryptophan-rich sensory protein